MAAEVIPFRPVHYVDPIASKCSDFQKALFSVKILMDFTVKEALELIHLWVGFGILTEKEAKALFAFYEIEG